MTESKEQSASALFVPPNLSFDPKGEKSKPGKRSAILNFTRKVSAFLVI